MRIPKSAAIILAAVLALSVFAACGGGSKQEPASSAPVEQVEQASSEDSGLPTLEELISSDVMQAMLSAAMEQNSSEEITGKIYAEGDELRYDYTMNGIELTDEEIAVYGEMLKQSTAEQAESYQNTANDMKNSVSNDTVTVVVTFMDGAGNVIYTESFTSGEGE